jgi:hypothetical protein
MFAVWSSVAAPAPRRRSAAEISRRSWAAVSSTCGLATIPSGEEAVIDIVAVHGWRRNHRAADLGSAAHRSLPVHGRRRRQTIPSASDRSERGRVAKSVARLVLRGLVMMGGVHIKT